MFLICPFVRSHGGSSIPLVGEYIIITVVMSRSQREMEVKSTETDVMYHRVVVKKKKTPSVVQFTAKVVFTWTVALATETVSVPTLRFMVNI